MSSKTTELSLDEIFNLAKTALLNNGANEENADAVAATVTNAERDGSVSHGLFRIPGYIKALQSKKVDGSAKPEIEEVTPTIQAIIIFSAIKIELGVLIVLTLPLSICKTGEFS